MSDKIYIIGHKSPDLDSIAAAISYAKFKNLMDQTDKYVPARAGELNEASKFVLEKFGFAAPELLENAAGCNLILVDHNESMQAIGGLANAKLIEVLDHHKMDFRYIEPIEINVRPWGSSNSIIASLFYQHNMEIEKNLAGLMLSAILDDTVITKSPTCTENDKKFIIELAQLANISNWQEYGLEIFRAKSCIKEMKAEQIVNNDFKDFITKSGKFGIGQVETVDLKEFAGKENELLAALDKLRGVGEYHSVILFITDIMQEGSKFLISSNDENSVAMALGTKLKDHQVYIPGIMSRKKQVAPLIMENFDK